jgi:hypothetical protein
MPPEAFHSENISDPVEVDATEKLIADQLQDSSNRFGELFDQCSARNEDPRQKIIDEGGQGASREIYGDSRMDQFFDTVNKVSIASRKDFIDDMLALAEPFFRLRFTDPEVKSRADTLELTSEPEEIIAGALTARIHSSEHAYSLNDSTVISETDLVLEVGVPADRPPKGTKEILQSLHQLAEIIRQNPTIRAVIGTSWMMGRDVINRLGFEVIPEAEVPVDQRENILDMALTARRDKNYHKQPTTDDVKMGGMSREEFLKRYG